MVFCLFFLAAHTHKNVSLSSSEVTLDAGATTACLADLLLLQDSADPQHHDEVAENICEPDRGGRLLRNSPARVKDYSTSLTKEPA